MSSPVLEVQEEEKVITSLREFLYGLGVSTSITAAYALYLYYFPRYILDSRLMPTPFAWSYLVLTLVCSPLFEYLRLRHNRAKGSSSFFLGCLIVVTFTVIISMRE